MSAFIKTVSAAAVVTVLGLGAQSHAASVLKSGDTVDGWKVTFPVGIALTNDGGSHLTLEKMAAFDSLEGLDITFTQVKYTASSKIEITDESITNVSGQDFNGFQFLALNTLPGNAAPAALEGNAFTGGTAPFTKQSDSADTITLSGGVLHDTDTAKWGFGANGGALVIDANPAASGMRKVFDFKEIPVAAVPLPAAGWTGLSGLLGLGLIAHAKKIKKVLA